MNYSTLAFLLQYNTTSFHIVLLPKFRVGHTTIRHSINGAENYASRTCSRSIHSEDSNQYASHYRQHTLTNMLPAPWLSLGC